MTQPATRPRRYRRARPAQIGRWVRVRIYIAGGVLTLLFASIAYKAYGLQVADADKYRQLAARQHLRTVKMPAPRGAILDAKGRELAVTADADSAFANPREIDDITSTAAQVAEILGTDLRVMEAKLASRQHFVWLERHVPAPRAQALREAGLKGIELTAEPRRFYPGRQLAGPVLGFAGIDGDGLDGVELSMDELLAGRRAQFAALRDASGRVMMADGVTDAQPGATLTLTLDRAIQFIAERALFEAVNTNMAKAGMIVVLDVASGAVLAMANAPTYDPNQPGASPARARNRCVTDAFEVGSTMKIFTIAAGLDVGAVNTHEVIDVEGGRYRIGRKLFRDTFRDQQLTVGGIIKRSSNVGAVKIAMRTGKQRLHDALLRFGFGARTGIELPGERAGLVRPHQRWGDIALASISFGYGMTATPLQVAAALAAIGNGGVYHEPRIVARVTDASGEDVYRHQPTSRRVLKRETADALLPMLASVFDKGRDGGTARSLDLRGFRAGGKTGTARKVDPETRHYSTELYLASFAGLAPIEAPRIAVVVIVDEPRGEHYYGGKVAGPAFVRVVEETLRYLGVPAADREMAAAEARQ